MAIEVLYVPERHLRDVICIIRAGIQASKSDVDAQKISMEVEAALEKWCNDEEAYIDDA